MLRRNKIRFILTLVLLTIYAFLITLGASNLNWDGPMPLILTWLVITPVGAYLLGMFWRYDLVPRDLKETDVEQSAKRKRQAIDDVLRDLSDEDLVRLRQRLQNGTINDDVLYEQLGEDGEWIANQRNQ